MVLGRPLTHKPVLKPPDGVWEQFDDEQRLLWFIDEVEARWQNVLIAMPQLEHLTVSYCDSTAGFEEAWDAVADFIADGSERIRPSACAAHHHTDAMANLPSDEELASKDAQYQRTHAAR